MNDVLMELALHGRVSLFVQTDSKWHCAIELIPEVQDSFLQISGMGSTPESAVASLEEKLEIAWPLLNQVFRNSCVAYSKKTKP